MNLYNSWIYEHFLNTNWFMWTIVVIVFGLNTIAPILIWFVMSSRKMPFRRKKQSGN